MKHTITLIAFLFLCCASSNAQVTLANSFGPYYSQSEIVNLSLSGKKFMIISPVANISTPSQVDTISFYNLDFSFWKRIVCPNVPGYDISNNDIDAMVYYPSETLFNTDALLEIAVYYVNKNSSFPAKFLIINESGVIIDSMTNVFNINYTSNPNSYGLLKVYSVDTLGLGFQAVVTTTAGIDIYNLPGSLPCSTCSGNGLGVAKNEKTNNGIQTQPLPNPSSNEVKITFTLPEGTNQADLVLYNTMGQKLKSYTVDNRFGYILLDNSQLTSGIYYYNIEVNGMVSSTQKMVVIK